MTFALTRAFDGGPALAFGLAAVVVVVLPAARDDLESLVEEAGLWKRSCSKVATVRAEHVVADATACLTVSACACGVGAVIIMTNFV